MAHKTTQPKHGFTLVELLVVIAIIGTLVALLIPAVQAARATARKAVCSNNLKQLGIAIINYETSKGRLPGYVQSLKRSNGEYLQINTGNGMADSRFYHIDGAAKVNSQISWVGVMLPFMEGQPIYDNLVDATISGNSDPRTQIKPLETLICPDDSLKDIPEFAGLTYSANTGAWDYEYGDDPRGYLTPSSAIPDRGDTKHNGLLQNLARGSVKTKLTDSQSASTNLMFSENVHKEIESENYVYTWLGVDRNTIAEQFLGLVWVVSTDPQNESVSTTLYQAPINSDEIASFSSFQPFLPAFARPTGNHPGGAFNVVYADGHGGSLTPDIDYTIYQRLIRTNGRKIVDPEDHTVTAGAIQAYRQLPVLVEEDLLQ